MHRPNILLIMVDQMRGDCTQLFAGKQQQNVLACLQTDQNRKEEEQWH